MRPGLSAPKRDLIWRDVGAQFAKTKVSLISFRPYCAQLPPLAKAPRCQILLFDRRRARAEHIQPLIVADEGTATEDVLIVQFNPHERKMTPTTSHEIVIG